MMFGLICYAQRERLRMPDQLVNSILHDRMGLNSELMGPGINGTKCSAKVLSSPVGSSADAAAG
jgi:hypothetical protein